MENPVVSGLRSRSRSKTPFLRSSCDREICGVEGEHTIHHKSGRKTPVKPSTPVKYVSTQNTIEEEAPTGFRTRYSTRHEKVTSDYSSGESPDRVNTSSKEVIQNEINTQYERGSSRSQQYSSSLADFSISPIQTSHRSHHVTHDRSSSRFGSPSYSVCSTDSSFAEQTLADAINLIDTGADLTHLPYKLYKMAGEYWNKYPKTDYTYSPLSKDRVELAPGQVAVPNMSRRSLSNFRLFGPSTSPDEVDRLAATKTWAASTVRKRYDNNIDGSDDEAYYQNGHYAGVERGWFAQLLLTIITTVTTATSNAYRKVFGPTHRYPYTDRKPQGMVSRTASAVVAPVYWIITIIKKIVTTTVTTVTETITPNHVGVTETHVSRNYKQTKAVKRRWWPWILLLLLPLAAYGCYNYREQILPRQTETVLSDTYKSPIIVQDEELARRVAALEDWALSVDQKLKYFDQKLLKLDNVEAQIEQFTVKHLQQNLFQIFTANDNFDAIAAKLKAYFDQHYMNKEQAEVLSRALHENLLNSRQTEMDEEKIRSIIQEYLGVFERRQMELIKERVKVYVKEIEIRNEGGFDVDAVRKIVADMLTIYDADKTGLVDYALESAGGQVISTKCTEMYHIKTKQYFVLGIPMWWGFTSPRYALTAGAMPSECWAFQNFPGYLVIRTYAIIEVTGFSIEHMSRLLAVDGKIESAPKNFSVYGLHGELDPEPHLFGDYMYDANGTSIQYFPVKHHKTTNIGGVEYPVAYDIIELRIESNHGNPNYTCLYRFRVHGNPLSDIRRATEDSMKDSET